MSNWGDIKQAYADLSAALQGSGDFEQAWNIFSSVAVESEQNPPYHLRILLELLNDVQSGRRRQDVTILDHGCGGAVSLLYLLALGYEGIHGVDVGGACEDWNRLTNEHLGLKGQRFFIYDGSTLPFRNDTFDFIFSNQVIEHLEDHVLEAFYSEEGRVLVPGGMAYHQVPHRLVPYDSHTRTWFIHYLPRSIWLRILRAMGRDSETAVKHLFLRWPSTHRRFARLHLGCVEDRTMDRFIGVTDLSYFEGPRALRRSLGVLVAMPGLGPIVQKLFANFVMLDTVSKLPLKSSKSGDRVVMPRHF